MRVCMYVHYTYTTVIGGPIRMIDIAVIIVDLLQNGLIFEAPAIYIYIYILAYKEANRRGRCRNCSCFKKMQPYQSCLPSWTTVPAHPDTIITVDLLDAHPVLLESLDATMIRSAVLYTGGAGGPSGLDAMSWRRLHLSFNLSFLELCHSLAFVARRFCSELVGTANIALLMASCLIAVDKNPGICSIGIGDSVRFNIP